MPAFIVDLIVVSQHVNAKINGIHNLTIGDVEHAWEHRISARMGPNEDGVERLLAKGVTPTGRKISLVLYPTQQFGVWNLATAFPIQ